MNSTKANILGAFIITLSLVIIGVSVSYAYYVNTVEEVNKENQGVSVTSGDLTMNFATSQTITTTSASLIKDSEITTKADYTAFSITLPSDADVNNASYSLFFTDTTMSSNFKSSYVKWALYSNDALVTSGDFSGVTLGTQTGNVYSASDLQILDTANLTKGQTTNYKLYLWLSHSDTVLQNDLLNGTLSTKVGFRAVSK